MNKDDYIVITGSRDLNDDNKDDEYILEEDADSYRRALEEQGVFLDKEEVAPVITEALNDFSKTLQELGGVEIITTINNSKDY